jgi:hypothetical protein
MNLMNNFVWSVAAGVLMVASAGCGKTDATPPTLEVVVAGVQPGAEVEVDAGSTVSVTVLVQDETELSQLRIDLHICTKQTGLCQRMSAEYGTSSSMQSMSKGTKQRLW